ncbi:uncharacterized protein MELLADRAFT_84523 [Melampsora larici-populina 98AG31]|uniref:Uncharacterized protein n=1 Tax=Melampsora larici-populina (strain 98AG31 / pathotype 3-4-7) TaxID=747676 RepID=F4SCB7_MELLP|nr:uncharacterized protein MELLADRAFT_84523 [Melampsora larici-populina 98AG31]EGF97709.1 hypothetical protein MELLADRAFT_84523 [Melampsora larici-populina 98AG31]
MRKPATPYNSTFPIYSGFGPSPGRQLPVPHAGNHGLHRAWSLHLWQLRNRDEALIKRNRVLVNPCENEELLEPSVDCVRTVGTFYLSGYFESPGPFNTDQAIQATYRNYYSTITCMGTDGTQLLTNQIEAIGLSTPELQLLPRHIYFLRGEFFPTTRLNGAVDEFFFEGSDRRQVGNHTTFMESLADGVGLTGTGIVLSINSAVNQNVNYSESFPANPDNMTLFVIAQHCDYHPKYHIPPSENFDPYRQVVKVGSECQFHGYIKGFNEATRRYIVVVNKVSSMVARAQIAQSESEPHLDMFHRLDRANQSSQPAPQTPRRTPSLDFEPTPSVATQGPSTPSSTGIPHSTNSTSSSTTSNKNKKRPRRQAASRSRADTSYNSTKKH